MADKGNKVPKGFDLPDYLVPIAPVQRTDGTDRKPNLIYVCHKNMLEREKVFVYKKKYGAYSKQYSRHDTPAYFRNNETPGEAYWERDWNRRNLTYGVSNFVDKYLPTNEMVKAAYAGEGYYSTTKVEEIEKEEEAPKRGKTMGSLFSAKMEERILEAVSMSIASGISSRSWDTSHNAMKSSLRHKRLCLRVLCMRSSTWCAISSRTIFQSS
jgi:hypothetical protein